MFNSQLRKQSVQFHGQDGFGSGYGSRISIAATQSDSRRRRRRGVGGTSGGHLFPEAISQYAPQTYDAVWAIALALRAAEEHWRRNEEQSKLDGFDYTRSDMAWEFLQQMGKLHFLGVSVSYLFQLKSSNPFNFDPKVLKSSSSRVFLFLVGPRFLQRPRSRWHHCLLSNPARFAGTGGPLLSGHGCPGLPVSPLPAGEVAQRAGTHRQAGVQAAGGDHRSTGLLHHRHPLQRGNRSGHRLPGVQSALSEAEVRR